MRKFCVVTLLGCIFLLSSSTLGQGTLAPLQDSARPSGASVPIAALTITNTEPV